NREGGVHGPAGETDPGRAAPRVDTPLSSSWARAVPPVRARGSRLSRGSRFRDSAGSLGSERTDQTATRDANDQTARTAARGQLGDRAAECPSGRSTGALERR